MSEPTFEPISHEEWQRSYTELAGLADDALKRVEALTDEIVRLRAALDQLRNACAMVPAVAEWVPDDGLTYISARTCREVWEAVRAALNPPATVAAAEGGGDD